MQATAYNAGRLACVEGAIDYLASLPLFLEEKEFTVVHHSPFHLPAPGESPSIGCFDYLDEASLAGNLGAWRNHPKRLIFSGHDHLPGVYVLPDSGSHPQIEDVRVHRPRGSTSLTLEIDPECRYWVKTGSIGGPYRDGCPVANAVLYDDGAQTLTLLRIPFPRAALRRDLAENRFFRNIPTIQRYLELLEKDVC